MLGGTCPCREVLKGDILEVQAIWKINGMLPFIAGGGVQSQRCLTTFVLGHFEKTPALWQTILVFIPNVLHRMSDKAHNVGSCDGRSVT